METLIEILNSNKGGTKNQELRTKTARDSWSEFLLPSTALIQIQYFNKGFKIETHRFGFLVPSTALIEIQYISIRISIRGNPGTKNPYRRIPGSLSS